MIQFFNTILAEPLYNLLAGIYAIVPGHDIGVTIIILTIVIKAVLWPLSAKAMKSQRALQEVQPKLKGLKEKYKDDKEGLAKAMMELYSKEKVNPLSSCLPLLIQLPIIIALYRVLLRGINGEGGYYNLYSFVPDPGVIVPTFMGIVDLSTPNIILAILAGIFQFIQAKMMILKRPPKQVQGSPGAKDEDMAATMNRSMLYFMPVITVVIGASLPAGLTLYWLVVNIIAVLQQLIYMRPKKKSVEV